MQKKYILITLFSLFIFFTQGCSHTPTLGEDMIEQGDSTKSLGKKWNHGEALVKKGHKSIEQGEAMIKKGEKLIDKGHDKIKNGRKLIKKGNKLMQKSETSYHHVITSENNNEDIQD
ncbi:MAG: hypothetical protein JSR17_05130 [Proteobacteria bacterium]|nr:hypothetical protein [Pseudomonadota bacterium]